MEPLQALAEVAGAALVNVETHQSEQLVAQEQTRAALTDELTGLPNRRHADQVLSEITARTSLVMIDVDHFRVVNERFGHAGATSSSIRSPRTWSSACGMGTSLPASGARSSCSSCRVPTSTRP